MTECVSCPKIKHIPARIRWRGGAKVWAHFRMCKDGSSVVAAVLGEATYGHLCKSGVQLLGRRYGVGAFEEAWPQDPFYGQCSEWRHITPHRSPATAPRCALCAEGYLATDRQCPIEGCRVGKGHPCPHGGPSAQTAGRPMGHVRMPASSRGVPASPLGCGGHHPPTKGARSWGP